jgi:hypothetical protein
MELDPLADPQSADLDCACAWQHNFSGSYSKLDALRRKARGPLCGVALFALVFAGASAAFLAFTGGAGAPLDAFVQQYLILAACGLLSGADLAEPVYGHDRRTRQQGDSRIPAGQHIYVDRFTFSLWRAAWLMEDLLRHRNSARHRVHRERIQNLGGQLWFIYALIAALASAGTALLRRGFLGDAFDETLFQTARSAAACVFLWISCSSAASRTHWVI